MRGIGSLTEEGRTSVVPATSAGPREGRAAMATPYERIPSRRGDGSTLPGIIGNGSAMAEVFRITQQVAPSRACVLIVGETGTGKELIARAIHDLSPRSTGPYIRVNCGALTESLLESELFGHVKGSFTGAVDNRTGRFEAAHTGSISLAEITTTQPKLQSTPPRACPE